jgi:hypothetical protein
MDIYSILTSKPHNPHYLNRYINFIQQCQQKNVGYDGYTENHHFCPKAKDMFPEYVCFRKNPWNKAPLNPRQHFIAHLLLWKSYPTLHCMLEAVNYMSENISKQAVNKNSRLYAKLRTEFIEFRKTKVAVKDSEGCNFLVDKNDSRYLSGELVGVTKGMCVVVDHLGNKFMTETYNLNTNGLRSIHKGKVTVKDELGNKFKVDLENERYRNGTLIPENKDLVLVKDKEGNIFKAHKSDPRFITNEIFGVAKGMVNVKDKEGNKFQVSSDDERFATGDIKHEAEGKIGITNGKINKMIENHEIIPEGWYKGITKKSQRGMICITNGVDNSRIYSHEIMPEGWYKGITRKNK